MHIYLPCRVFKGCSLSCPGQFFCLTFVPRQLVRLNGHEAVCSTVDGWAGGTQKFRRTAKAWSTEEKGVEILRFQGAPLRHETRRSSLMSKWTKQNRSLWTWTETNYFEIIRYFRIIYPVSILMYQHTSAYRLCIRQHTDFVHKCSLPACVMVTCDFKPVSPLHKILNLYDWNLSNLSMPEHQTPKLYCQCNHTLCNFVKTARNVCRIFGRFDRIQTFKVSSRKCESTI